MTDVCSISFLSCCLLLTQLDIFQPRLQHPGEPRHPGEFRLRHVPEHRRGYCRIRIRPKYFVFHRGSRDRYRRGLINESDGFSVHISYTLDLYISEDSLGFCHFYCFKRVLRSPFIPRPFQSPYRLFFIDMNWICAREVGVGVTIFLHILSLIKLRIFSELASDGFLARLVINQAFLRATLIQLGSLRSDYYYFITTIILFLPNTCFIVEKGMYLVPASATSLFSFCSFQEALRCTLCNVISSFLSFIFFLALLWLSHLVTS